MSTPVNHLGGKCPCIPFFIGGQMSEGGNVLHSVLKQIFKCFYHICAWYPSWSCDLNFHSPFQRRLHMKFGFDWPSGFRGEDV